MSLENLTDGEEKPLNHLEEMLGQRLNQTIADPTATLLLRPSPPTHKSKFEEVSEDASASRIARNMDVWFHNPWAMVEDGAIYTLDPVDILNPIKQLPNKPWLEYICNYWLSGLLTLVPKSRRMMISWLMAFLHLHLAMFNEGVNIFFVRDKEEKSDELVKRAEFILKFIPENMML